MREHGSIIDGAKCLPRAVSTFHFGQLADTSHELVGARRCIPRLGGLLADEARRVDVWTAAEQLTEEPHLVTGSMAGTSVAPTRLAIVYVDSAESAALALDHVPTEAGANVWLLEPYDDVVFERTRLKPVAVGATSMECVAVSLPQTAVDLMSSPGRGPQEAEALLEQMKGTVDDWRREPRS
jgi:hypothetical protein